MLPSTSAVQSVVAVISVCCGLFSGQRWGSRCLFERRVSPEVNGRLRLGSPEAILFPGGYLMQQSHPTPEMEPQVEKEVLALDAQASLQRGLERVNVNWNYTPEPIMREALLCFTHSAKLGNMDAKALLGIFLYEGWQIPRDVDRGVMLSKEAADAGSPWGYFAYARCCFHGTGSVTRDVGLSAVLYHKAAECGLPKAQCNLGYCYGNGVGVPKDGKTAREWYLRGAILKDAPTQCNLGLSFKEGITDHQAYFIFDTHPDFHVTRFAIEQMTTGSFSGFFNLALCYEAGIGCNEDLSKSVELYQLAARGGFPQAQCNLGFALQQGKGVKRNRDEAYAWYLKAAAQNYPQALCNVGYCLRTGFGVEKDMQAGLEYYYRAAKMQNSQAQLNLGFCFRNGNSGVQKDPIEAFHWFLSAAQQGHHNAERMVAHCYLDGTGIRTNLRDALRWAELAQQHEKSSNIVADVMLRCFWGRWCHHQFPSNLGSSMKAVILSARRASCNLPVEIWEVVFSFLHYKDYRALGKVMSDHSERETQAMGPAFATE